MKCPRCKKREMEVTHSFKAGDSASTQTLECPGCNCIAAVVAEIVEIDPPYGQGAQALAKQIQRKTLLEGACREWSYVRDGD